MGVTTTAVLLVICGYLLGSVPFGLLIAKIFYRVDIRQSGSGNTGATNVWRTLGRAPGMATLALDIFKGMAIVITARFLAPGNEILAVGCGLASIIGHNWSLFLKGKGGKGVATSAGVFLALIPKQTGVAALVFLVCLITTGHVSIG